MKKMIMSVLVMALMVTSLVGCGSKETVAESTETEVVATPEPTVEPTPELTPEPTPTPTPEPTPEEIVANELGIELQEGDVVKEIDDLYEKGYEILHADGTSTMDVEFDGDKHYMHLRISHLNQDMTTRIGGKGWFRRSSIKQENGELKTLEIFIVPQTIDDLNLKELSNDEIGATANGGRGTYYNLQRTETEDSYITTCEFDVSIEGVPGYGYDKMINDYKTGKAYDIALYGNKKYFDIELAKEIVESIQFFVETEDGELVVIGGEEPEQEVTVVETVELKRGNAHGTKTIYSDDTADYEIWYDCSYNGDSIHYKLPNLPTHGELYSTEENVILEFVDLPDKEEAFKIFVWTKGDIDSSKINLKTATDEFLGTYDGKNPDYSLMEETETDTMHTVGIPYIFYDMGRDCGAYNLYFNDYETGKAYYIMPYGTEKYSDYDFLYDIAHSLEVIEVK